MFIEDLVPAYKDYLQHERRLAPATVQAYCIDLQELARHVRKPVSNIELGDLREFQRHLSKLGRKTTTINRKFHGFGTFWEWCVWEGHATEKITERIRLPKQKRSIKAWMTIPEVKRFLSTPVTRRCTRLALRDETAFLLLAYLGLRRSEVVNLKVEDVKLIDEMLIIRAGKGKRDRVLPILYEYKYHLERLIGSRKSGWVFRSMSNKKWGLKDLNDAFTLQLERAGLQGRGYTPHTMRHTFATMMIRSGKDVHIVKEFLGHEDIETTALYLHTGPIESVPNLV